MQNRIPEELILKHLSNEASLSEVEKLHNWLAENPQHMTIFQEYVEIYNKEYNDQKSFDLKRGLDLLNDKIEAHEQHQLRTPVRAKHRWWYAAAASFAILSVAFTGFYLSKKEQTQPVAHVVKQNPNGQKSTFRLPDGSLIKLNAGSTLRFPEVFSAKERRVTLTGEAFFDIVPDKSRPFTVVTDDLTTTVLGTSFNIKSFDETNEVAVSVATGKVLVKSGAGSSAVLAPEEEAVYNRETHDLLKREASMASILAWKENILWFENSRLAEVAKRLEKWYNIDVSFDGTQIQGCRITGKFMDENLVNVLNAIKIGTGINYEKNGKHVILSGNGCK